MQLVPLSTDGRVSAVCDVAPPRGPLRVALEPDAYGVGIVALGPGTPRPIGRLAAPDAARYAPVLRGLMGRGLVGTCPARATVGRTLVLDLAPASECVLDNLPGDLVLLTAERRVTVTQEEHHQDVLAGRSGRVAVSLHPSPISAGKYAGQPGLAVALDGRRVGELTQLMAQRYLPIVQQIAARGRRAGCEASLRVDHRGVQVELLLPAVDTATGPVPPVPVVPAPVAPLPPSPPGSTGGRRRDRRRIVLAGAAVVGVLAFTGLVGIVGNDEQAGTPRTSTVAAAVPAPDSDRTTEEPTSTSAAPSSTATADAVPTGTARARAEAGGAAATPKRTPSRTATRTIAKPPAATNSAKPPAATNSAKPSPRSSSATPSPTARKPAPKPETKPESKPKPEPEPEPEPTGSGCDPNYSGCVPIASDVDCEGGSGNGPAFVKGPVRVIGKDIYGLDKGGEPGVGCE